MFYINKIVGWLLSPLGFAFVGIAAGWLLARLRFRGRSLRRFGIVIACLSLIQLWFFSCGIATRLVGVPLEGDEAALGADGLPVGESADAIVLLGGGVGIHEHCGRSELFGGADRAWLAARLFRAGRAPLLTVSGGGAPGELKFLADLGVDTNRVALIESARNTEEEARLIAAEIARRQPDQASRATRVLLVTSAWHLPRARSLFERAGFEVVPAPTDYEMHYAVEYQYQPSDFFPSPEALVRNSYAIKEWVARFCYAIKGVR